MPKQFRPLAASLAVAIGMLLTPGVAVKAEDKVELSPELQRLLAEEKEARKACKIQICRSLRLQERDGGPVQCKVVKSMPKPSMNDIMKRAKVSWPYGLTRCETDLEVSREMLADAMSKPKYEATLKEHTVTCTIKREPKEPYKFVISVAPQIMFESGKAVKANLKWGKIDAPILVKGIVWPATGVDNRLNVFGSKVVEIANTFIGKKCDEVKDALN